MTTGSHRQESGLGAGARQAPSTAGAAYLQKAGGGGLVSSVTYMMGDRWCQPCGEHKPQCF